MILGGGPSLNDFTEEIREKRQAGMPLVTTNGAYHWCLDRGLNPSAQVVIDGRPFNKRFVQPHIEGCYYFLASQCHPETIEAAPRHQILLFHAGEKKLLQEILDDYDKKKGAGRRWYYVDGGATVMLRTIPLFIMLGYSKMHIYGFDSCLREGKDHAYEQPENRVKKQFEVSVGKKKFMCTPWMFIQAQQFIEEQKIIANDCELAVYGDGLIAHIIETGAEIAKELYDGSECI